MLAVQSKQAILSSRKDCLFLLYIKNVKYVRFEKETTPKKRKVMPKTKFKKPFKIVRNLKGKQNIHIKKRKMCDKTITRICYGIIGLFAMQSIQEATAICSVSLKRIFTLMKKSDKEYQMKRRDFVQFLNEISPFSIVSTNIIQ